MTIWFAIWFLKSPLKTKSITLEIFSVGTVNIPSKLPLFVRKSVHYGHFRAKQEKSFVKKIIEFEVHRLYFSFYGKIYQILILNNCNTEFLVKNTNDLIWVWFKINLNFCDFDLIGNQFLNNWFDLIENLFLNTLGTSYPKGTLIALDN
jgi:hypothetical protein